jgi:hypothetical protein
MVDITERICRRSLHVRLLGDRVLVNSGKRVPRPQPAEAERPRTGAKSTEILRFADTPFYRVQAGTAVKPKVFYSLGREAKTVFGSK